MGCKHFLEVMKTFLKTVLFPTQQVLTQCRLCCRSVKEFNSLKVDCELCFLGPTTSTQHNSILTQFRKICPKIKINTKEELLILGSPISELCRLKIKGFEISRIS